MKPSVHLQNDQPKKTSKRVDKKSVNHNWNSRLFFQIGLIVSLLITGLVLESTLGLTVTRAKTGKDHGFEEPPMITYRIEPPKTVAVDKPRKKVKPVVRKQVITNTITPVSDDTPVIETNVAATSVTNTPTTPTVTAPVTPVVDDSPKSILNVDSVPVFPGCEGLSNNDDRIACMSEKVKRFIGKKFDIDKFSYLDPGSRVRIYVDFQIDKTGNVTEIVARAPDKRLEQEAARVVGKLPTMAPGKVSNKPVTVQYLVPIVLQIQ